MRPEPFRLERFFAKHEFSARYLLSTSDCQGLAMADLLAGADAELRARWDRVRLGYTESQGLPELRAEIATLYETVSADEILVAAPEELVFLTMNALLAPGDHVVCTFPGYQSLYELARSIGCEVALWKPVEALAEPAGAGETAGAGRGTHDGAGPEAAARPASCPGGLWRFNPAALEALLRPDTKLVVWNFPHNPTGALPSGADYARVLAAAAATGARVFSDEMYRLLEPRDEMRLPAAVDLYDRAVSLSGMSKAFGLAGLRIGWVATHDRQLLERMKSLKDYTTICSSAPSELLALMGLRARDGILAANRERVQRNVELTRRSFARLESLLSWAPPQGGTVCFPRLTDAAARAAGGAEAFCARLLQDTGVLLLPSTVYDYGDRHFRLGLGRDDFADGLRVLTEYHSRGH